jgi:putative nucleotidyltransferase with HDIG domain
MTRSIRPVLDVRSVLALSARAGLGRVRRVCEVLSREPAIARDLDAPFLRDKVSALVEIMDRLDIEPLSHSRRVAAWAKLLAREIGLDDAEASIVTTAALLHDVGKLAVSDDVLFKQTHYVARDWDELLTHSDHGAALLDASVPDEIVAIVRGHHEHWDGSGYPGALCGDAIPIGARIFHLVDSYDAMRRSDRDFRPARSHEEAWAEIERLAGELYDPVLVSHVARIGEAPWSTIADVR